MRNLINSNAITVRYKQTNSYIKICDIVGDYKVKISLGK